MTFRISDTLSPAISPFLGASIPCLPTIVFGTRLTRHMKPIAVCTRCIFEDGLIEVTTTAHEGEHFPTLRRRFDAHIGSFTPRMLRCGDTAYGLVNLGRAKGAVDDNRVVTPTTRPVLPTLRGLLGKAEYVNRC